MTVSILARELQWDKKRSMLALNVLLREGMTWLDEQVQTVELERNVGGRCLMLFCWLCRWIWSRLANLRTFSRVSHCRVLILSIWQLVLDSVPGK